jgi:very-short-patch-repair endonuclease
VRRVLGRADGRAANPFESVLRHLALDVPGLRLVPQRVVIGTRQTVRPDLVDDDLRIVVEADSFEWHGGRADLRRDACRYNLLVVDGWLVLRFSWEDVMFDPDHVRDVLTAAARMRTQVRRCPSCTAYKVDETD